MSSVSSSPLYLGNNLRELSPHKFGGTQENYLKLSNETIQKAVDCIKRTEEKAKDLFSRVFDLFTETRKQIAKEQGDANYEHFGKIRTIESAALSSTPCLAEYEFTGNALKNGIIKDLITELLAGKKAEKGDFNCRIKARFSIIPDENKTMALMPKAKLNDEQARSVEELKTTDPERYQQIRDYYSASAYQLTMYSLSHKAHGPFNFSNTLRIFDLPQDSKVRMLAISVAISVENKILQIGEFITLYRGEIPANLTDFVQINHMHAENMVPMLNNIADIFLQIVTAKEIDAKKLKLDLAEFRYKFAYCMPCLNGSAAIAEWFEVTLAAYHNYKVQLAGDTHIDLMAFRNPYYPDFTTSYEQKVQLSPKEISL